VGILRGALGSPKPSPGQPVNRDGHNAGRRGVLVRVGRSTPTCCGQERSFFLGVTAAAWRATVPVPMGSRADGDQPGTRAVGIAGRCSPHANYRYGNLNDLRDRRGRLGADVHRPRPVTLCRLVWDAMTVIQVGSRRMDAKMSSHPCRARGLGALIPGGG